MVTIIINDTGKFKKLKDNPTLTRKGQLQRFLRKIKDKNLFDENTYKKVCPCGSKPAAIYGLPKTHKMLFDSDDFSLRTIISSIGTYNYNLAKFLTELLDPVIPKEHCAKDSFSFCEEIQQVSSKNNFLVLYDVCSLFTTIPLQETIEIAVALIFENNPQLKVTKHELKQHFNFVTSGAHFRCSWDITKRNSCKNLTKERLSCINVMLMILFVCLEMKRMQKIYLNFLPVSIKI